MYSRLLFLIIISFFTFQLYAIPTNYFISPTGNNTNNGLTSTAPKATLANVFSTYNLGAGDTIFVAAGIYTTEKNITLGSDDEGFVIQGAALDAAGVPTSIFKSDNNGRWLIFSDEKNSNIKLNKIKIENYKATGGATTSGGAIYSNDLNIKNLKISDCYFENCNSGNGSVFGGAIYFQKYVGGTENTWEISNTNFVNCSAVEGGGAVYISAGHKLHLNITKCKFITNSLTGVGAGSAIFYDCPTSTVFTMTNCLVYGNKINGNNHGCIYLKGGCIGNLTNCTIANNSAPVSYTGGVYFTDGGSKLTNCIIYNNSFKDIYCASGATNLNYSYYKNLYRITVLNSFTSDPGFKNVASNDYSLATTSTCIDAATAAGAPSDDILSVSRPLGAGYDIGAYESNPCSVGAASSTPSVCINSLLTNITHTTSGATGIDGTTNNYGLPSGLSASYDIVTGTITISGTPSVSGTFSYSIPLLGGCGGLSATGTIKVDEASVGGSLTGGTTVCSGTNSTVLTLSGYKGTITKWQSSIDGTTWTDISNNTPTHTASNLTATTQYRAEVKSGVCNSENSSIQTINVVNKPTITLQPTAGSICEGGTYSPRVTVTGGTSLTYQWQYSTTSGGSYSDVANSTPANATYSNETKATLSVTGSIAAGSGYYYKCVVSDAGSGCTSVTSNAVQLTVNGVPTISGQPTAGSICEGGTYSPSVTVTGGTSLTYQWQYSTTSGGIYSDVANSTPSNATYSNGTTANLSITGNIAAGSGYYYKCVVSDAGSGCTTVTSSVISLEVKADPTWLTNSVTPTTVCLGSDVTFNATVSGGLGNSITWNRATTTGGVGATVTTPNTESTTGNFYYRPVYTSTVSGCNLADGTESTIKVNPLPQAPTLDKTKVYCKSDISLNFTNIKFTSPAIASSQQYFVFYKAGLPILPELLNNANGNYQVAFFDGECLGDKLTFNFPTDIELNPGPTLTNPLSDVVMCQNEKPDLALVESKASLPAGTVSWYATSNDLNPIIKSTKVTNTNTTYYLSIMDNVTNCMNETRFPIVVKLNSGENIQLNPLFGLCSNTSYTVAYLDKSVTNDLSKGTIKWYNDNTLPIVGQSLSKNDKVDFTKSYYAMYVPINTQLCSSDIKELLPMNLVTVTVNPILPLSQTNQDFCYEPVRFVSDLNFLPYNSSEIQVFSEASNPNAKLDLVEKLISAPYYIKTKKVLINTTCYSDNFTTINVNVNKPALETETHFSNCGKKNGYIKLTSYPNNAIITWYKDNILLSDNSVALKGLDKGEFKIVINDNGCVRSKNIELNDCIPSEIPHIITPNNDSKNDFWVLGYYEKYPNVSVQIMNRWGNKVFESDKPYKDNWDGKNMNGEFLPTGTYFYIIDKGNGEQVISGFVEFVK